MSVINAALPIPITRRHHLQVFTDALEANGVSTKSIARHLGLPLWQYGSANDWIPLRDTLAFFSEATRVTNEGQLGLLVSQRSHPVTTTAFGKLVATAPTLYSALRTTCKLARQHTSVAHVWLADAGDTVWLCRDQHAGMSVGLREHEQYVIGFFMELVRLAAGPTWQPTEVCLSAPHQPRLEESDDLATAAISYNQAYTAIALPKSIVCRPLKTSGPLGCNIAMEVKHSPPADDFAGSLRQIVMTLVADGATSLAEVADILRLHPRTLQRRLRSNGTTYQEVLEEARFRIAVKLLKLPGATATDVGNAVGYSDLSSFSRAFRQFAGVSPRQYLDIDAKL
jgi:AraC-like DNA-binding protein